MGPLRNEREKMKECIVEAYLSQGNFLYLETGDASGGSGGQPAKEGNSMQRRE
jgi:hypothetical protein